MNNSDNASRGRGRRKPQQKRRGDFRGRDQRGGGSHNRGRQRDDRRSPLEEKDLFRGRKGVESDDSQFARYLLEDNLNKAIAESGYAEITPFQEKVIHPLLERKNLIAQAARGAGKTAGYLIPILHTLTGRMGPRALILTPTRDLAIKVFNEVRRLAFYLETRSVLIDPGSSINGQAKQLEDDPEIVIGTPGRLLDHIRRGNLKPEELDCLVLDELDRMFDHGQRPDVDAVIKKIYSCDQTIIFSTTFSPPVLRLSRRVADDAAEFLTVPEKPVVEAVNHRYVKAGSGNKISMVQRLIEMECPDRALVFCRNKGTAAAVQERLRTLQGGAMELHMGMIQRKQEQVIKRFREKEFNILITTDTFTHDLDVENLSHVINFDIPEDIEDYLFRIGRMSRLDRPGKSVTFVNEDEMDLLKKIESETGGDFDELELPGMEPEEAKPESRSARSEPRAARSESRRPAPRSEPRPAAPRPTPAAPSVPDEPKPEYIHGGWHRKRPRRGRR